MAAKGLKGLSRSAFRARLFSHQGSLCAPCELIFMSLNAYDTYVAPHFELLGEGR